MPTATAGAADTPPARKPNPKLNQRPPRALFCLKLDNSCYARYSCGNNCNFVVKLVQECKFFLRILLLFYDSMKTVRRERHVSYGSEQLQASARIKKLVAEHHTAKVTAEEQYKNHTHITKLLIISYRE